MYARFCPMKVNVSGLGGKHELELDASETVRAVKARLEPLTGLASVEMKLLVKGKAPDDSQTVGGLGLTDGGKVMLMRSKLGARASAPPAAAPVKTGGPAWLAVSSRVQYRNADGKFEGAIIRAVHTDDPTEHYYTIALDAGGGERQTPAARLRPPDSGALGPAALAEAIDAASVSAATRSVPPPEREPEAAPDEAGEGAVVLTVSHGRRQLTVRCEPASTIVQIKTLLAGMVGGTPASMKLLLKGKEATDASSAESLSLASGGRMMLLFRAQHHKEVEGAAAVRSCTERLVVLRERIAKARHQMTKRLLTGAEALARLGELDGEVEALTQDLRNAAPNEAAEAATLRKTQLAELEALTEELSEARKAEAQAELRAQLGR